MTRSLLGGWAWLWSAIALAALASASGAAAEGIVHAPDTRVALVGGGESVALVLPAVVLALALGRGLWLAWQPVVADRGRGPEVLAGLGYVAGVITAVLAVGYLAARLGVRTTRLGWLAALIAAAGASAAAALALALARPAVQGGTWLVERAWPGLTPARALGAAALAAVAAAIAAWIAARPLLARYDLGLAAYGAGFVAGAVVALIAASRWRTGVARLAGAGVVVAVAAKVVASMTVATDPAALLDAWSQLPVSGRAIEWRHDVGTLRAAVGAAVPAPVARTSDHPDILLITIDALRADRLGPATTPALAALAADSASFSRAYAPSTVTRGSLPVIMTSRSPGRIRGRLIDFAVKLDPRHVLLAERFQRAGYTTRGFLCCAHHFGGAFDLGLDRGLAQVLYDPDGAHLAQAAMTFFADPALDGRPRFGWLHTYEPHQWAREYPAALYGDAPAPRYDRSVADVDRVLAPLIAAARGRARPTIIVVTADHGEGLGDHGVRYHAGVPYSSQLHVPLLIAAPGLAPRQVSTPVGLIGLGDTLLDLAGFTPPPSDGPSFAALVSGAPAAAAGEAYSAVLRDRVIPFTARSLVLGDRHLVEVDGRDPELYDLESDPGELVDLAAREPERLAELRRRLQAHRARDRVAPF